MSLHCIILYISFCIFNLIDINVPTWFNIDEWMGNLVCSYTKKKYFFELMYFPFEFETDLESYLFYYSLEWLENIFLSRIMEDFEDEVNDSM